jgi:hypothetical protein
MEAKMLISYRFANDKSELRKHRPEPGQTFQTMEDARIDVLTKKHPTLLKAVMSHITHSFSSVFVEKRFICDATPFALFDASRASVSRADAMVTPVSAYSPNPDPAKVREEILSRLPALLAADEPDASSGEAKT